MSRTVINARKRLFALALIVSLVVATALAQDAARDASGVNLATGDAGEYLVDAAGMALYLYVPDAQVTSTCYDDCATAWPPFVVTSADALPAAGAGVDASLFGTIDRDDGSLQLTYNGWPLYYFASDLEAGAVGGQGMGGNWFLVSALGDAVGAEADDAGSDEGDDGEGE